MKEDHRGHQKSSKGWRGNGDLDKEVSQAKYSWYPCPPPPPVQNLPEEAKLFLWGGGGLSCKLHQQHQSCKLYIDSEHFGEF